MKKQEEKKETEVSADTGSKRLPPALDFGGPLGHSSCSRSGGFDNTPSAPHDWSRMKPPPYPSLF